MNPEESVSTRFELLFDESRRIIVAASREVLVFVACMAALATATDLFASGVQTGVNLAGLIAGYYLTRSMTVKAGFTGAEVKRSIWPYIGLGILSEFGVLLGFVLLVVPGVVLGIRWLAAYGFLLAGGEGVTQSMKSSWEATRGHFLPLLFAAIVPLVVLIGGAGMQAFLTPEGQAPGLAVSLGGNLAIYCGSVLWTALGLAAYSLLAHERHGAELAEVFS